MAYVTGTAADYTELLTALRDACVANGWTLTGNVLSKGAIYINTEVANLRSTGNLMPRLVIRASNDSSMTDAPDNRVGLGHYDTTSARGVQFPATYKIFVHASPDNVFMKVIYSTTHHQWLAFGNCSVPGLPGTGNFASGTTNLSAVILTGDNMTWSSGYAFGNNNQNYVSGNLFYRSLTADVVGPAGYNNHHHMGDVGQGSSHWSGRANSAVDASQNALELLRYSPSAWSQEALLIPITPTIKVGNNVHIVGKIIRLEISLITVEINGWFFPGT
jgi:hypothetical protein